MRVGTLHKLAARAVTSAPDGLHSDGGGLFLRVRGDSRSWVFRFTRDGRKREKGLGSLATTGLSSARRKAAEAREAVAAGLDPIAIAAAAPAPAPVRAVPTLREALARHMAAFGPELSNAKHRRQWSTSLEQHAAAIMDLPVDRITPGDVEAVLLPIWASKAETAGRVRQRIERILSGCIARGDRPAPNPAAWRDNLEHLLPKQRKRVRHHAAVPVDEAPAAFAAIWRKRRDGIGYAGLVTLALTALRSGEVRGLEWGDIDPATATIALPGERMKARRPHRVPVSWPAALHLSEQPRWAETPLVTPGQGGRAAMSDMTMAKALAGAGWPDATPHGWRSTFADWASAEGWPRELVEDHLAHRVGTATERAYRRSDYLDRRRPMVEAWGAFLVSAL